MNNKETMNSFTNQWSYFKGGDRTWGKTVTQIKQTFLEEMDTDPESLNNKLIMDAGCGVGTVSEVMNDLGMRVVALDLSEGIYKAKTRVDNVVRGDLSNLPFKRGVFDIVYAKGTLHHTPNTYLSFKECTNTLNKDGQIYIWVYCKSTGFKRLLLEYIKPNLLHVPMKLKRHVYLPIVILRMIREGSNFNEAMVNTFDFFSTPFRHEFHDSTIYGWFDNLNFTKVRQTNNTKEGFGFLGVKKE